MDSDPVIDIETTGTAAGGPSPRRPEWAGFPDHRLRLAFLNQSREIGLGALFGLGLAARILGAPIPAGGLALLAAWGGLAWALTRLGSKVLAPERLSHVAFAYFLLELALIMALAQAVRVSTWLALIFDLIAVLYAVMLLPQPLARWIAVAAAGCFSVLMMRDYLAHRPDRWAAVRRQHPVELGLLVALVALDGYALLGLALSQFLRMLKGQSRALQSANQGLAAAGQELRLHRDHLEEMVARRTSDLQLATDKLRGANQELQRLNQLKSNFLANVSHELRTPLTSIRSFTEILLDYPDEDVFTRCEFLEIIVQETDRLTRLINDVLDLAKIEANKMSWNLRSVGLGGVVRASMGVVQVVAAHRDLKLVNLVPGEGPWVRADPDRVRQVLMNLLSNAIKFTPSGTIQVGVLDASGDEPREEAEVVLFVSDTGCGIPPEELEHIFEKFYQHGQTLTDKPSGSGLGLSICREIMTNMGGRIWAESNPPHGSVFYCALPAASPAEGERASGSARATTPGRLVAD